MNRELRNRIFDIPENILDKINHTLTVNKNVFGSKRAMKLLADKKVKYGQLKRIIHDLSNIDKINDRVRFDLYGGDDMLSWGKQFLKGERDLISNRKDSRKTADNIGAITGERKNSHRKSTKKRFSAKIPVNMVKSNSFKNSVGSLITKSLFEEIEKIKKLIIY